MSLDDIDSLKNASVIIERFGGIRPMAAKVGAPVTTVQGWKKRDVIPGSRRDDVLRAANENNIDIKDLLQSNAPSSAIFIPQNIKEDDAQESSFADGSERNDDDVKITVEPLKRPQPKPLPASFSTPVDSTHEELMAAIALGQKKAMRNSFITMLMFTAVLGGAGAFLLWPSAKKIQQHEGQIAQLETKVDQLDEGSIVPEDMRKTLSELKTQADDLKKNVMSGDMRSVTDRLSILEAKLGDVEGGQTLKDLTTRIRGLEVTVAGQQQLNDSVDELKKIVDSLDGQMNAMDDQIAIMQKTPGSALGETLDGVSGSDMKAAALLIAFSQLRESINRHEPFEDDLVLLQKLVGNDDPELQAALVKLAPQAEQGGVLTVEGLQDEFKGLAGDIVISSLKGEEVSPTEKAKVRLTQILNIKKDGELVGGTPTQKTVAKAQDQLDKGDIEGAIATLKTLDGDAKTTAEPFIDQAQAALLADQVQNMLRQMIVASVGTNMNTAAGSGLSGVTTKIQNAMPGSDVVKDDQSGFAILPSPKGFKGFSSGTPE